MSFSLREYSKGSLIIGLLLAFIGFSPPSLSAQDGGAIVTFRVACFQHVKGFTKAKLASAHVRGISDALPAFHANPEEGFPLSQTNLSPLYRARLIGTSLFFLVPAKETESPDEPAVPPLPIAKADFPNPPPRQALVLLLPGDSTPNTPPYRCVVLDASEQQLPAGSNLFVNLSRKAVRGRVGEHEVALGSGQRKTISQITKISERGYFELYWEQPNNATPPQWQRAAWTQWRYDKGTRRFCLFFDDTRGQGERLSVKTFTEFLTDGEAGAAPPVDDALKPPSKPEAPPR
jgi:hypothetical protein